MLNIQISDLATERHPRSGFEVHSAAEAGLDRTTLGLKEKPCPGVLPACPSLFSNGASPFLPLALSFLL